MRTQRLVMYVGFIIIVLLGAWVMSGRLTERIDSYAKCVAEGYPVQESNPPTCRASKHTFVGPLVSPGPSSEAAASIPFEIMVDGDSRGDYATEQQVITRHDEWVRYWASIHRAVEPLPPILPADFSTQNVVALSEGRQPTGGYDVKITSISGNSAGTTVYVTETIPGAGCVVTQSLTNPYFIASTEKLIEPVSFRITKETRRCSP